MSEDRKKILNMLSEGKISVEEAERLIAAIENKSESARSVYAPVKAGELPKYLRVLIDSGEKDGHEKVNVRIPFQLLKAGIKLSSLLPNHARHKVDNAFHEKGLNFDLKNLKEGDLEEIVIALRELSVDITSDDGEKIKVFCE